jgi:peroxiredoxin
MFRSLSIAILIAGSVVGCGHAGSPQVAQPDGVAIAAIDGRMIHPLDPAGHTASVLLFVLQDCPICNGYAPRVQRLVSQFSARGVQFYLVQVDPMLSDAEAAAHAKEYGYTIPVLVDRRHELVHRLGVVSVPTAVVIGPGGAVRYEGRIDNRYFALGKPREAATTDDLRTALDAVIEHKPLTVARTKVIGCAVPDLPKTSDAR